MNDKKKIKKIIKNIILDERINLNNDIFFYKNENKKYENKIIVIKNEIISLETKLLFLRDDLNEKLKKIIRKKYEIYCEYKNISEKILKKNVKIEKMLKTQILKMLKITNLSFISRKELKHLIANSKREVIIHTNNLNVSKIITKNNEIFYILIANKNMSNKTQHFLRLWNYYINSFDIDIILIKILLTNIFNLILFIFNKLHLYYPINKFINLNKINKEDINNLLKFFYSNCKNYNSKIDKYLFPNNNLTNNLIKFIKILNIVIS